MLLFIYSMLKEKSFFAMLFFSISFSIKLQTIIILPILVLALVIGKIKWKHLLEVPIVYLISMLPALIAGRPIGELLSIYGGQVTEYESMLTLGYPNFYYWLGENIPTSFGVVGILVCATVVGSILYQTLHFIYKKVEVGNNMLKNRLTNVQLISFTLLTGAVMLYMLPHMHERYGYFIDVLMVLYVVLKPTKWYLAVMWSFISFMSYFPFLFMSEPIIDLKTQAIVQGVTIILIALDYIDSLKQDERILN